MTNLCASHFVNSELVTSRDCDACLMRGALQDIAFLAKQLQDGHAVVKAEAQAIEQRAKRALNHDRNKKAL